MQKEAARTSDFGTRTSSSSSSIREVTQRNSCFIKHKLLLKTCRFSSRALPRSSDKKEHHRCLLQCTKKKKKQQLTTTTTNIKSKKPAPSSGSSLCSWSLYILVISSKHRGNYLFSSSPVDDQKLSCPSRHHATTLAAANVNFSCWRRRLKTRRKKPSACHVSAQSYSC